MMTTVSSITPLLPYTRRVSFNNLQHEDHEAGAPPDVTRLHSYTMSPKEAVPKSADPELSKLFSTYSLSSSATSTPRKRLRLPDPPSKSILKNKLSTEQLRSNVAHAIEFGASFNKELNDLVNHPPESVPRSELAKVLGGDPSRSYSEVFAADSDDESSPLASPLTSPLTSPHGPPHAPPHAPPPERRRKSYSSMTNEELMALDPQFSKPNSSNLKDFKFDAVGPVYGAQRKNSAPGMMVSPPVKAKQVLYPSSNENNYQSVTLTVKHKDFEHKHAYPRTLLTVISGRKHTWNTLDWLLLTDESLKETPGFLQNGDHLVVAALVPLKFLQAENKSNSRKKDTPEKKVQQKCENILEYVLDNLPDPNIRLKITVELVIDAPQPDPMTLSSSLPKRFQTGTKFMMSHLFKQYQPTLVVVGNKSTSLNFQYPRRMSRGTSSATTSRSSISPTTAGFGKQTDSEIEHYLVKLSSYLIRYSTVPVIMVGNSTIFHRKPVPKVLPSVTFTDSSSKQRGILDYSSGSYRHNSIGSDVSIESFCGEQINEDGWDCGCPSSNPSRRPSEPSENSSDPLERPVDPLERPVDASTRPSDPSRCPCNQPSESSQRPSDPFAAMLSDISKSSLWDSRNYLESIIADKLPAHFADNKVHQAYISTEQGRQSMLSKTNSLGATAKAYKVKSLISYNEEDEKKNEKMINEKKIKKSISRNSAGSSVSGATEEKSAKKKRSFLQKLGLKK